MWILYITFGTGGSPYLQIIPIPERVQKIPGRLSDAVYEAVFRVASIPALGLRSYIISKKSEEKPIEPIPTKFISNKVNI